MLEVFYKAQECIEHSMSEFQIKQFVVEDHITPYRKVKQVVIELRSRLENKTMAEFERDEIQIDIDRLEHELEFNVFANEFARRKHELELTKQKYMLDRKQSQLDLHEREIRVFMESFEKLVNEYGGEETFLEQITDAEYRNEEEKNYWTEKLARGLVGDLVSTGVISRGIYETVVNLPKEQQTLIYDKAIKTQMAIVHELEQSKDQFLVEND